MVGKAGDAGARSGSESSHSSAKYPYVGTVPAYFQVGIRWAYMCDDYTPQLLEAFEQLRCAGEHDITNFCDRFETHIIGLREACIPMADTVILAVRVDPCLQLLLLITQHELYDM
jgi:hypothetical protein